MMKSFAPDGRLKIEDLRFLERRELIKLKVRALRRGVWYRILSRIERGLVDLAIITVRRVQSPVLARSLIVAVKRLLSSMKGKVARQIQNVGYQFAEKLARVALSWGNRSALSWVTDCAFVRFLAVCHLNMASHFGG
jgi:hypothetical protein